MVTRLSGQVLYYPYVEGANVRVVSGSAISGEALANVGGNPSDVLFATGQLTVTSPIEQIGYQHVIARGHVVAPKATEPKLLSRLVSISGQVVPWSAPPRVFDGKDHFSAGFFELFEEPITLVLDGRYSFDEDVMPDLLRRAVGAIILDGKLRAPKRLVPMLQMLCIARDGKIESFDDPE